MRHGSTIALSTAGPVYALAGRVSEHGGQTSPTLQRGERAVELGGYEIVHDVAVAGDRVVALTEGSSDGVIVAVLDLELAREEARLLGEEYRRAAVTARGVFVAHAREVRVLRAGAATALVSDGELVDLAATAERLAILRRDRIDWHDAEGRWLSRTPLVDGDAIAVDRVELGWLVAARDRVLHLRGPDDAPRTIAELPSPATKIRRSRRALHACIEWQLVSLGDGDLQLRGRLDPNGWRRVDFDAGPEGLYALSLPPPNRLAD